jgi:mono/diheme cytochrome c family protein
MMKSCLSVRVWIPLILIPILFIPVSALGQEDPSACVVQGGLAYDNWTKEDSGGTGSLPEGAEDSDYVRCKACHGWDHMATDGGYVRRSRNEGRSNAGAGDGDMTSRNISFAAREEGEAVTADMVWHEGTGRAYSDGKASWVALDETHSAANKAAHSNGFTLGNQHPDYSIGGMTQEQVDCLVEFLNFADADPTAYFAAINPHMNPVHYTIIETADSAAGETFYSGNCNGCHGDPAGESPVGAPDGGILAYLAQDGKFSEFSHKVRWGIPDTSMDRDAMGSPTSADVANMMLWLQEEGGTGFAVNPGLTGTWWNAARSGEGFVLEFGFSNDALTLFASFYTYDNMGNQVWLTAQSTAIDGADVTVTVYISSGPMWGDDYDPADVNLVQWGTGTFVFPSCTAGSVSLTPSEDMVAMGFSDLAYELTRDVIVSGIECPTATAN